MLEHGKDNAQVPLVLASAYDAHDSVSLGRDENLGARIRDENSASANNKFLVCI